MERYPVDIKSSISIESYVNFLLNKYDNLSEIYKSPTVIYYYLSCIALTEEEYKNKLDRMNNASKKVSIDLTAEIPLNLPLLLKIDIF